MFTFGRNFSVCSALVPPTVFWGHVRDVDLPASSEPLEVIRLLPSIVSGQDKPFPLRKVLLVLTPTPMGSILGEFISLIIAPNFFLSLDRRPTL